MARNCPFPLRFRHPAGVGPSHGHRQHAQKFGKDRARGSGDMRADRQTDTQNRHTYKQTYSSQYFATAPASEVATAWCWLGVEVVSSRRETVPRIATRQLPNEHYQLLEPCNPWPHVANHHISISQQLSLWRHSHYDVTRAARAYGARKFATRSPAVPIMTSFSLWRHSLLTTSVTDERTLRTYVRTPLPRN